MKGRNTWVAIKCGDLGRDELRDGVREEQGLVNSSVEEEETAAVLTGFLRADGRG